MGIHVYGKENNLHICSTVDGHKIWGEGLAQNADLYEVSQSHLQKTIMRTRIYN
jgi:hypothetical protein